MNKITLSMVGTEYEHAVVYFDNKEELSKVDWENTYSIRDFEDVDYIQYGFVPEEICVNNKDYTLKQADSRTTGEPTDIEITGLAVADYQYTPAVTEDYEFEIEGDFDISKLTLVYVNGVCSEIEYDGMHIDEVYADTDGYTKSDGMEYIGFDPDDFIFEEDDDIDLDDLDLDEADAELEAALMAAQED